MDILNFKKENPNKVSMESLINDIKKELENPFKIESLPEKIFSLEKAIKKASKEEILKNLKDILYIREIIYSMEVITKSINQNVYSLLNKNLNKKV